MFFHVYSTASHPGRFLLFPLASISARQMCRKGRPCRFLIPPPTNQGFYIQGSSPTTNHTFIICRFIFATDPPRWGFCPTRNLNMSNLSSLAAIKLCRLARHPCAPTPVVGMPQGLSVCIHGFKFNRTCLRLSHSVPFQKRYASPPQGLLHQK